MAALHLRRCTAVGAAPELEGRPFVVNAGRLVIGARLRLASVPVQSHLIVARGGELLLGHDVVIGHGAAIFAHSRIAIGSGTHIGPFVTIADTDFHVAGRRDAEPEVSPVEIGRDVRIGSRVTVLRGAVIGDGARVLAGSVVSGQIPAGETVSGLPARRAGAGADAGEAPTPDRVALLVATALGLRAAPEVTAALAELDGWDSLAALRLLLILEETFGVTLDQDAVPRARHVLDLVTFVEAATAHVSR
jgi:acetyltransferase-like isoleucine patch superfamily enzyme/acyl carrier protein